MNTDDRIATNLRTLMILEVLGKNNRAMTATEINASLGLPKQTVHLVCVLPDCRSTVGIPVSYSHLTLPTKRIV